MGGRHESGIHIVRLSFVKVVYSKSFTEKGWCREALYTCWLISPQQLKSWCCFSCPWLTGRNWTAGTGETDQGQTGSLHLRDAACVCVCVCARAHAGLPSKVSFSLCRLWWKQKLDGFCLTDRTCSLVLSPHPTCILAAWMLLVSVAGSGTFGRVRSLCGHRACEASSCWPPRLGGFERTELPTWQKRKLRPREFEKLANLFCSQSVPFAFSLQLAYGCLWGLGFLLVVFFVCSTAGSSPARNQACAPGVLITGLHWTAWEVPWFLFLI